MTFYDKKKMMLYIFVVVISLSAACGKITTENYSRLKVGMEYSQVLKIIGEADKCDAALGAKSCIWGNEAKHIKIKFIGDKVVLFSGAGL